MARRQSGGLSLKQGKQVLTVLSVFLVAVVLFRVLGGPDGLLSHPKAAALLVFWQTGRDVTDLPEPHPTKPPEKYPPDTPKTPVVFSLSEGQALNLETRCAYKLERDKWLQLPLQWDLTEGVKVLIVHTHATESFTKTEAYEETADYRTLNEHYNMISIGNRVAEILRAGGVEVLHDTTLHDYPEYNGAYDRSRETVKRYLEQYPDITLVLDLHRDAMEDAGGNQISTTVMAGDQKAAQLMLVVGSDAGGLYHPDWQENMALAMKLQMMLERKAPGICRQLTLRESRYNQDLTPGTLLVEVGSAGNTRQEALAAAEILAQSVLALANGAIVK